MAATFPFFFFPAVDTADTPMSGALLYFYDAGTTTPKTVYSNSGLSIAHANPVVADSTGRFAAIYLSPATAYRAILKTSAGVTISDLDNFTSPAIALPTYTNLGGAVADNAALVTALALKAPLASPTFTGTVTIPTATAADSTTKAASTAFVQGELASYAAKAGAAFTGAITTTVTFGFATGAGGAVTQITSKSTGVTVNKACGQVTMHNAALAASTSVSFTMTNSVIAATDVVNVCIGSAATASSYVVVVDQVAAGSCRVHVRNVSAGSLGEALVLNFAVIKAVAA